MKTILTIILFLFSFLTLEAAVVVTDMPGDRIGKELWLYEDVSGKMPFDIIRQQQFVHSEKLIPNLALSQSAHWVRVDVVNRSSVDVLYLDLQSPSIDQVWFYSLDSSGHFFCDSISDATPISERLFKHQNYIFQLKLPVDSSATYYLKIVNGDQLQIPIVVGSESTINAYHNKDDLFFGVYSGVMLALLLYNIFVFFGTRERSYLLYVLYIGSVYLAQMVILGYSPRFLTFSFPEFERLAVFIIPPLAPIFAMLFMVDFLHVKSTLPKIMWVFRAYYAVYIVAIGCALAGYHNFSYQMLQSTTSTNALFQLTIAIVLAIRGVPNSRKYLLAWSVFLIGVIMFVLKDFEILPFNTITFGMMAIGSAAESVLLSFALADRINQLKAEKEVSQQKALEALKENEIIIKNQNEFLERKVQERTVALEESNSELVTTLKNLKLTQSQLIESEKLASLGQMTAGIAHELNNPINFVSSNVHPLKRDISDIVELLTDYSRLNGEADYHETLGKVKEKHKKLDVNMLTGEIDTLLNGINEGAKRTAEIVKGLRVFARTDKDTSVGANINECITSAIIVMKSALRGKTTPEVQLSSDMPDIYCFPGKLTQVVMNLVANAIYAIEQTGRPHQENSIVIRSWYDDQRVSFSVQDNGIGMNETLKNRIFEPFFTTKPVGEGTGLGLSIVSGIVSEHHGTIEVKSEIGKGSLFTVHLPRTRRQTP
ncbi:MAG: GHKL domain-containing protein [Flavobacteriales bacterium]|nr:GHKL domain-containing protein [Flavobacteriales bacterium]